MKEIDEKLLSKSSLDIDLLPENQQDRQMAALMKLQSKSAYEREEEKRLDILLKPALPSATQTTFGGIKRQKALNNQLQYEQLGIKRKVTSTEAETGDGKDDRSKELSKTELPICIDNVEDKSTKNETSPIAETDTSVLVNMPKSLALVCDYASSSSSPNASSSSDNENE